MNRCPENRAERRARERAERRRRSPHRTDAEGFVIELCPRCKSRLRPEDDLGEAKDDVGEADRSQREYMRGLWHWRCLLAEHIEREDGQPVSPEDLPELPELPEGWREVPAA